MRHGQPSPNRSIPWRAPLAALACVVCVGTIGWRIVDSRLAAEAARHASRGASPAVAALRDDWVTAIVPIAFSETGPVAERARQVASARIDLLVSEATRDDHKAFREQAESVLAALRNIDATPTDEAVRWGEWASRRIASAADRLAPEQRLELIASTERSLRSLAGRARRKSTDLPPPLPAVVEASVENPEPQVVEDEPPAADWFQPLPPPIVIETRPTPTEPEVVAAVPPTREPRQWNPAWGSAASPKGEPVKEATLPPALDQQSDRELLAELVRLAAQLPEEPTDTFAAGPKTLPKQEDEQDDPYAELRGEVMALRKELTSRGFYAVSDAQVASLLSQDTHVRVALVRQLLVERTGAAPRLLVLLAEDASPEVRAEAISALGSSNDQELTRLAWRLAMKDKSPEVGRLAETLRARLR